MNRRCYGSLCDYRRCPVIFPECWHYTLTIAGSGFGTLRAPFPFSGDTAYLRIGDDAQVGHGEWGFFGDMNPLTYRSWSAKKIVVGGFGGNPGDALQIAIWNPQPGGGEGAWGGNVPGGPPRPRITSVGVARSGRGLSFTIRGTDFGRAPVGMPFTGDLNFLWLEDWGQHCGASSSLFGAGFAGWGISRPDAVTFRYSSWSNTKIVIRGLAGSYGSGCASIFRGDSLTIGVYATGDASDTGPQTAWAGRA